MAKYRISEITYQNGQKKYLIEKRFLGFLWWYDPYEDGLFSDGYCDSFEAALKKVNYSINYHRNKKVIWNSK